LQEDIGEGNDPLCGDRCTVYLYVAGGVIKEVSFEGAGCAIMMPTASLMTLALMGKTKEQAQVVAEQFGEMLMEGGPVDDNLGDLAALAGVRDLPNRIKCALLPWRAMREAIMT
jgi:nitrogen fixation NifU-like protein